jgi:hypothetical protein
MLPLLLVRTKLGGIATDTEIINVDHRIVGIISFVLVNPLVATPLFFPARAALFGLVVYKPRGRRVAKSKICRKASLFQAMHLSPPPCQHGLVSNGKSHLVMDPSHVARSVVECNLRVVWRGSQRVNLSVCMYVYVYVTVKCGGIVGGGGTL